LDATKGAEFKMSEEEIKWVIVLENIDYRPCWIK